MATGMLDSVLFADMFGTAAMRAIFSDTAYIARCAEVEAALARAEARIGVIPAEAAAAISRAIDRETVLSKLDLPRLGRETLIVGYPILPLVRQLAALAGEAGRYVHWGATTQDIMDTATVLQVRDGLALIEAEIETLRGHLAALARKYRDTPMAGRTHLQHALPVTFGYKAAVWLSSLDRHRDRLRELRPRALLAQFGGAAGTLASLGNGDEGIQVCTALAAELDLVDPPIPWHVARDGLAEAVQFLALLLGTLGKIALDVMIMAATELGEVAEPFVEGRGASSTMPQKRNPISCELMLAASKAVRQQAGLMLDAMVTDFERATGPWHAEWIALPESFSYAAGALSQANFLMAGLVVDTGAMQRNLDATHGLIVAEAVMMALAPHTGRNEAHDFVYDACRAAIERDRPFLDALKEIPEITAALDEAALRRLVDPANYLGAAPLMVDRVLAGGA